ncbi:DedA family protein [Holophaga foetida]|uniref:DedA family protein n=1 Tax=Holophaga foetida TaxID=35839 RepID=UPI0002471CB2|nr:DedA family protein [Holophaga foetida]
MAWLHLALDFLRRLTNPETLNLMAGQMDGWLYVVLFAIIFCETGLVVLPFLPGDSLLFAIGALGAIPGTPLNLWLLGLLLVVAAVLGDAVNYSIGARLGPAVFHNEGGRWLNKKHLMAAHEFYEKYGGKTIILARFVPIVRTFAPFVAGIGKMTYSHFALYNISGAILWVGLIMAAGRIFGGIPWVKTHFESVLVAIIVISVLPAIVEYFRSRRKALA